MVNDFTGIAQDLVGFYIGSKTSVNGEGPTFIFQVEALAIIAYREPVTRPLIDSIRGVNSDGVLKSLLSKGLIQEIGRADSPGRPILYSTTPDFLQHFGLASLAELPPLEPDEEIPEAES